MSNNFYILTTNGTFTNIPEISNIPGYPSIVPQKAAADVAAAKLRASAITFMPVDSHLECPDDKCVYLKLVQGSYDLCMNVNSDNILTTTKCSSIKGQIFKFENNKLSLPFIDNKYITVDNVHDNGYQLKVTDSVNSASNFVFDSSGRMFTTVSSTTNEELTLCMIDHKIKACKANAGSVNLWKIYKYPKVTSEFTTDILKVPGNNDGRIADRYIKTSDGKCLTFPDSDSGNLTAIDCSFINGDNQKFEAHSVGYEGLFVLKDKKSGKKSVTVLSDGNLKVGSDVSLFYRDASKIRYLNDPSKCIGSSGGNVSMMPCGTANTSETNLSYVTLAKPAFFDGGNATDYILKSSDNKCLTVDTDGSTSDRTLSMGDCMNNKYQQFKLTTAHTPAYPGPGITIIKNDMLNDDGCLELSDETKNTLTFKHSNKCANNNINQLFYLDKQSGGKIYYAKDPSRCIMNNATLGSCASAPTFTATTPDKSVVDNILNNYREPIRGQIRVTDGTNIKCLSSGGEGNVQLASCSQDDTKQSFTFKESSSSILNKIGLYGQCLKLDTQPDGNLYASSNCPEASIKWTLKNDGKLAFGDGQFCVKADITGGTLKRTDCNSSNGLPKFLTNVQSPQNTDFINLNNQSLTTQIGSGPELCLARTDDNYSGTDTKVKKVKLVNCRDDNMHGFHYNKNSQRLSVDEGGWCIVKKGVDDVAAMTGSDCNNLADAKWTMNNDDNKIRLYASSTDLINNPKCIGITNNEGIYSTKLVNCNTGGTKFTVKNRSSTNKYPVGVANDNYIVHTGGINGTSANKCLSRHGDNKAAFLDCAISNNTFKYEADNNWNLIKNKEGKCLQYDRGGTSGTSARFGDCKPLNMDNASYNQRWYKFDDTLRSGENPNMCLYSPNLTRDFALTVNDCAHYEKIAPKTEANTFSAAARGFSDWRYLKIIGGDYTGNYLYCQYGQGAHGYSLSDVAGLGSAGYGDVEDASNINVSLRDRYKFKYDLSSGRIWVNISGIGEYSLSHCIGAASGEECNKIGLNDHRCYGNDLIGEAYFKKTNASSNYTCWRINNDGTIQVRKSPDGNKMSEVVDAYIYLCSGNGFRAFLRSRNDPNININNILKVKLYYNKNDPV